MFNSVIMPATNSAAVDPNLLADLFFRKIDLYSSVFLGVSGIILAAVTIISGFSLTLSILKNKELKEEAKENQKKIAAILAESKKQIKKYEDETNELIDAAKKQFDNVKTTAAENFVQLNEVFQLSINFMNKNVEMMKEVESKIINASSTLEKLNTKNNREPFQENLEQLSSIMSSVTQSLSTQIPSFEKYIQQVSSIPTVPTPNFDNVFRPKLNIPTVPTPNFDNVFRPKLNIPTVPTPNFDNVFRPKPTVPAVFSTNKPKVQKQKTSKTKSTNKK